MSSFFPSINLHSKELSNINSLDHLQKFDLKTESSERVCKTISSISNASIIDYTNLYSSIDYIEKLPYKNELAKFDSLALLNTKKSNVSTKTLMNEPKSIYFYIFIKKKIKMVKI